MNNDIICFNQEPLFNYWKSKNIKLDVNDWAIISWIKNYLNVPWIETIKMNGKTYLRFSYKQIIDDLLILHIKNKEVIARRINKLVKAWLLEKYVKDNNTTYLHCTEIFYNLMK